MAKQGKGICAYCGKEIAKGTVNKHLSACAPRLAAIAKAEQGKGTSEALYHLRVQDAYQKEFWLDLEMRGSKTLNDLDAYLRAIWLECCGHLSEFSLQRFGDTIGMSRKLRDVFQFTDTINHAYDFGTTSETVVKCMGVRTGKPTTSKPIVLLVRNKMPEATCMECGQPAAYLCMECVYEHEATGFLCEEHAEDHPHDDYGEPLPVFNSPRTGMCGYCGPAEPPY